MTRTIEFDQWTEPCPIKGTITRTGWRPVRDVCAELDDALAEAFPDTYEGIGVVYTLRSTPEATLEHLVPEGLWRVIVYVVRGSSEGHYLHVDALGVVNDRSTSRRCVPLFQSKTFAGRSGAVALCAKAAELLGVL